MNWSCVCECLCLSQCFWTVQIKLTWHAATLKLASSPNCIDTVGKEGQFRKIKDDWMAVEEATDWEEWEVDYQWLLVASSSTSCMQI